MSTPVYLQANEVAAQLGGKSIAFVKAHSRFNNPRLPVLKAYKILGRYVWKQEDVDAFIAENTKTKS